MSGTSEAIGTIIVDGLRDDSQSDSEFDYERSDNRERVENRMVVHESCQAAQFSAESTESDCNGRCLVDTEHLLLLPPPHPHGGGVESFLDPRRSSPSAYVIDHQWMKERMSHIVRSKEGHTGRWLTAWAVVAAIKGPVSGHGAGAGEPSSSSSRASCETSPHGHDHDERERWGRRMPILNVRPVQGMPFVPAAAAGKSTRVAGKDADGAGAGSRRGRAMRKDVDVDVDDQA
ncbi:hypothetical protein CVT25_008066 [Psilocybe cyanescens]|uniref:Uncharacterized protein n=1 Tax=Psilocybe cyanescens TaxID=93625 RepID=A0A409WAB9_PSICY|nr:hypothetical protein CVT25_008066 [Psilocybe cyanescens]